MARVEMPSSFFVFGFCSDTRVEAGKGRDTEAGYEGAEGR